MRMQKAGLSQSGQTFVAQEGTMKPQFNLHAKYQVNGVGMIVIHRSKNRCTAAGPNRSQIACNPSGSSQVAKPLLNA